MVTHKISKEDAISVVELVSAKKYVEGEVNAQATAYELAQMVITACRTLNPDLFEKHDLYLSERADRKTV